MKRYNPEVAPVPTEWLALDEEVRMQRVEAYHRAVRVKVPKFTLHAAIHVVVENQIAEEVESVVRAMPRLMRQGLSRHEALHAVGSVFAEHYAEVARTHDKDLAATFMARYNAAVERLTAESWFRRYEDVDIDDD